LRPEQTAVEIFSELLRDMSERPTYVLFLCTGNSARSILAEAILNQRGRGAFEAFSAGSFPKGEVHPKAMELLKAKGLPVEGLRSKSWDEYAAPGAPPLDYVFTVCDNAAGEACPVWPGHPTSAHWGIPDPAAAEGSEIERRHAFLSAFNSLDERIKRFLALPLKALKGAELKAALSEIGRITL
jgi:protein-tyrosine-phosphatase